MGFRLTPRDEEVLCEVFLMRFALTSQIVGLCGFNSIGRCRTRIRVLREHGYLRRIRLECTGNSVIACAPKAAPIVSKILGVPLPEAKKACRKEPSLAQAEHAFAATEFRLLLGNSGPNVAWLSERQCTHAYEVNASGVWRKRLVKPDGFFKVLSESAIRCFFVEIDLGTVSISRIKAKLDSYGQYLSEAFEDAYGEAGFSVLIVCGNRSRIERIREVAPELTKVLFAERSELGRTGVWAEGAWIDSVGAPASLLMEEAR